MQTYPRRQILINRKEAQCKRALWRIGAVVLLIVVLALGIRHKSSATTQKESQKDSTVTLANVDAHAKTYRVGIQAGHWKNDELPDELYKLYWSTGAAAGGYEEWEVDLAVAKEAVKILKDNGVNTDLLPATVPENYQADAFVSIHADGNEDTSISGYKIASSVWDDHGAAAKLAEDISSVYSQQTGIQSDSYLAVSDDMTQYYAFNFSKYKYSISSTTPGVLIEAGYITNKSDRNLLTRSPRTVAKGIAEGILKYLGIQPKD